MLWVRKGVVHLFAAALFVALLATVAAVNFNRVLGNPSNVKTLVAESGVYDHAVSAALDQSQKDTATHGGDSSVSLNSNIVEQAAQRAFTPALLQQNANTIIDSNYAWLAGKTPAPDFQIDLTSAKQNFIDLIARYTTNRLKQLPACTAEQLAQLQLPVDPMTVTCLPAGIDPQTEGARVAQAVNNSDFLSKPVITAASLGRDETSASKPYYNRLSKAPKLYQLGKKLPLLVALAALACALAVLFIAPTRRKGWRRIGVVLLLAGLLLIITKFIGDTLVNRVSSKLHDSVSAQLQQPRNDFLHHLQAQLGQTNLIFGIIFVMLAVIIFAMLLKSREQAAQPKPTRAPAAPATVPAAVKTAPATPQTRLAPPTTTAPRLQTTPRKQPTMDIVGPAKPRPTKYAGPGTKTEVPPIKRRPGPRPPRLIQ
jgi:hypothetical protein